MQRDCPSTESSPQIHGQWQCPQVLCTRSVEHPGMTQESTLKAPMNDSFEWQCQVSGTRLEWWFGEGWHLECKSSKPRLVSLWIEGRWLDAKRQRSHLCRACKTFSQINKSSPRDFFATIQVICDFNYDFFLQYNVGHHALGSWVLWGPSWSLACPWQTMHILVHLGMVWQLHSISWSQRERERNLVQYTSQVCCDVFPLRNKV